MSRYVVRILVQNDVLWGDTIEAASAADARSAASNSFFAKPSDELTDKTKAHIAQCQANAYKFGFEITARISKAQ